GGQSKLVTGMIKRAMTAAYTNNVTVLVLNQARDVMNSRLPVIESPGGRALKHACSLRIELKSTEPYKATIKGQANKEFGYQVAALIKKSKVGSPKYTAHFDFYHDADAGYGIGIDRTKEIIALSMRLGAIQRSGAYYIHETFPADKNGKTQIQ